MFTHRARGFSMVELIIALSIMSIIIGTVFLALSQGSKNVQKGSFYIQSSNQAAWILMWLRKDMALSGLGNVKLPDDLKTNEWDASKGPLTFFSSKGAIVYDAKESKTGNFSIIRKEGNKTRLLGENLLSLIKITRIPGQSLKVSIVMKDPSQKASDFSINANIYSVRENPIAAFWK
ncbi:type II secretion system protein [bacterium]|nr:type II secretion system protein [bacterium]